GAAQHEQRLAGVGIERERLLERLDGLLVVAEQQVRLRETRQRVHGSRRELALTVAAAQAVLEDLVAQREALRLLRQAALDVLLVHGVRELHEIVVEE